MKRPNASIDGKRRRFVALAAAGAAQSAAFNDGASSASGAVQAS
jgi:hypothetical protein